jgi:hypothetical protein
LGYESRQEVLTVESYATVFEPLTLPAACDPAGARKPRLAWLPQVHQVQSQAELAGPMVLSGENHALNGFAVDGIRLGGATLPVQVARGVPPRGRPV